MLFRNALQRQLTKACQSQVRRHHPSPFDPMTTKGWKAAVKVREMRLASFGLSD